MESPQHSESGQQPCSQSLIPNLSDNLDWLSFYLTLILLWCIQLPCGYNLTGRLQDPKDPTRPATVKVLRQFIPYCIRPRLHSLITSVATHLTPTYGFPYIQLSDREAAYAQQSSYPTVNDIHFRINYALRGSNPQPFDCQPSKPLQHHQPLIQY